MRSIAAVALASTLIVSNAFAAEGSPLAAGKPAGVHQAQIQTPTLMIALGVGILAAGIGLAASGDGNNPITPATTTTSTTTTTTSTTTTTG